MKLREGILPIARAPIDFLVRLVQSSVHPGTGEKFQRTRPIVTATSGAQCALILTLSTPKQRRQDDEVTIVKSSFRYSGHLVVFLVTNVFADRLSAKILQEDKR